MDYDDNYDKIEEIRRLINESLQKDIENSVDTEVTDDDSIESFLDELEEDDVQVEDEDKSRDRHKYVSTIKKEKVDHYTRSDLLDCLKVALENNSHVTDVTISPNDSPAITAFINLGGYRDILWEIFLNESEELLQFYIYFPYGVHSELFSYLALELVILNTKIAEKDGLGYLSLTQDLDQVFHYYAFNYNSFEIDIYYATNIIRKLLDSIEPALFILDNINSGKNSLEDQREFVNVLSECTDFIIQRISDS